MTIILSTLRLNKIPIVAGDFYGSLVLLIRLKRKFQSKTAIEIRSLQFYEGRNSHKLCDTVTLLLFKSACL